MGKQGPCRHCGVTSTPLWRNGPPEKPVLCNACGSRWRTKGTLTNYTPLHCREPLDSDEIEAPKARHISFKPKEQNGHKKKQTNNNTVVGIEHQIPYSDQNFRKIFEGDKSNRSSSGSVISCSESCAKFATTEASDLTGSAQSIVWDTHTLVPSKRRTCVARPNPSPVEKLTKDLYSILHEQQSSNLSGYSEEDLLYGCETPVGSVDIGHYGGVLIRYPNSKAMDEESEASSIPINDKKAAYPGSASLLVDRECKGTGFSKLKRDQVSHETLDILRHRDSPLSSTDLKDVATLEVFKKHLTHEEQQRLVRYLPSIDNGKLPDSLKGMFQSPQFIESLSYFRQLLLEGIFDLSFSGANEEDRRTLKRLLLLNFSKSKWVEHYNKLKDVNGKNIAGGKKVASVANHIGHLNLTPLKRFRDSQNQQYEELKGDRSPKRASKSGDSIPTFAGTSLTHEADDFMDIEGACFSPRSLFASPEDDRRSVLGSMMSTGQSCDHQEGAAAWDQKPVLMGQGFLEKPG